MKTSIFFSGPGLTATLAVLLLLGACSKKPKSDLDQQSYSVGYTLGQQLTKVKDELNVDMVANGLVDGINSKSQLSTDELNRRLIEIQQKQNEKEALSAADNLKKSNDYITATSSKKGVRTLSPGILVEELKPGAGAGRNLKDDDEITVAYTAKHVDGRVFDQTNDPKGIKVRFHDLQIPGLKKVVAKMPVGAEWIVHLAPDQAYGASARPGIPSQSALVYEIKLISVKAKR